jgi:hypothetical protein
MSFINQIKQLTELDNDLKELNEKIKSIREKRNFLEKNIINTAKINNYSDTINIDNGKLKFINTKIPEPLTFKYLEKTLNKIIKNEAQVNLIMDHIKQNREIKIVPEIKRIYNN